MAVSYYRTTKRDFHCWVERFKHSYCNPNSITLARSLSVVVVCASLILDGSVLPIESIHTLLHFLSNRLCVRACLSASLSHWQFLLTNRSKSILFALSLLFLAMVYVFALVLFLHHLCFHRSDSHHLYPQSLSYSIARWCCYANDCLLSLSLLAVIIFVHFRYFPKASLASSFIVVICWRLHLSIVACVGWLLY